MSGSYTKEILRLAMEASQFPRLSDPTCTATHRAPLCGSMITLDLKLSSEGRLEQVGFALSACAFGQGSSALFAKHAIGLNSGELSGAVAKIKKWLDGGSDLPWPGFEDLAPVQPLSARHGAVLLPFEAAVKALSLVPAQ